MPVPLSPQAQQLYRDPYSAVFAGAPEWIRALLSILLPNPQVPYAFGSMKALGPGAYSKLSDSLMGFASNMSKQKGFAEQAYKYSLPIEVQIKGIEPFLDEVKGLSFTHAMARALRNWPGASIVPK